MSIFSIIWLNLKHIDQFTVFKKLVHCQRREITEFIRLSIRFIQTAFVNIPRLFQLDNFCKIIIFFSVGCFLPTHNQVIFLQVCHLFSLLVSSFLIFSVYLLPSMSAGLLLYLIIPTNDLLNRVRYNASHWRILNYSDCKSQCWDMKILFRTLIWRI